MLNGNVKLLGFFYFKNLKGRGFEMERILLSETELGELLKVDFKQKENKMILILKDYAAMTKKTIYISYWRNFVSAVNQVNEAVEKFSAIHRIPKKKSFDKKKWEKEYYQKNKKRIAERMAKYYRENKEAANERVTRWRKDNPERVKKSRNESAHRYYKKYTEKAKAANKRWQEAHPNYREEYREKNRAKVNKYSKEWEKQKRKKLAMMAFQK